MCHDFSAIICFIDEHCQIYIEVSLLLVRLGFIFQILLYIINHETCKKTSVCNKPIVQCGRWIYVNIYTRNLFICSPFKLLLRNCLQNLPCGDHPIVNHFLLNHFHIWQNHSIIMCRNHNIIMCWIVIVARFTPLNNGNLDLICLIHWSRWPPKKYYWGHKNFTLFVEFRIW